MKRINFVPMDFWGEPDEGSIDYKAWTMASLTITLYWKDDETICMQRSMFDNNTMTIFL